MNKLLKLIILSVFLTLAMDAFAQTVYVDKNDSKYHRLTCKYLDPSHDSLNITFALKKGLGACPVCNPSAKGASSSGNMGSMDAPKNMNAPKSMEKSGMEQKVNSSANVAQQCTFIDKDGKRCTGKVESGTVFCEMHKNSKK